MMGGMLHRPLLSFLTFNQCTQRKRYTYLEDKPQFAARPDHEQSFPDIGEERTERLFVQKLLTTQTPATANIHSVMKLSG